MPQGAQAFWRISFAMGTADVTYFAAAFLHLQRNLRILSHTTNVPLHQNIPQQPSVVDPNRPRNNQYATTQRLPTPVNSQTLTILKLLQCNKKTVTTLDFRMNITCHRLLPNLE